MRIKLKKLEVSVEVMKNQLKPQTSNASLFKLQNSLIKCNRSSPELGVIPCLRQSHSKYFKDNGKKLYHKRLTIHTLF